MGKASNHGGTRHGAGRKPKALKYAAELASAEDKIISALPQIINELISAAKDGDVAAARYLLDRVFGRVKEQEFPLADDQRIPYDETDLQLAQLNKANSDDVSALIGKL
jgi:hypothetical protein